MVGTEEDPLHHVNHGIEDIWGRTEPKREELSPHRPDSATSHPRGNDGMDAILCCNVQARHQICHQGFWTVLSNHVNDLVNSDLQQCRVNAIILLKINGSKNVSCLLDLALRVHNIFLVWRWISSY